MRVPLLVFTKQAHPSSAQNADSGPDQKAVLELGQGFRAKTALHPRHPHRTHRPPICQKSTDKQGPRAINGSSVPRTGESHPPIAGKSIRQPGTPASFRPGPYAHTAFCRRVSPPVEPENGSSGDPSSTSATRIF